MNMQRISTRQHMKAIAACRDGKPTEGVLMRFNEQEFYLLNLTAELAALKGYSSRQAWLRAVIRAAMREELTEHEATQSLAEAFLSDNEGDRQG